MGYGNGLQAYKQARVNTASQGDLLIMLYDAAIRHVNRASQGLATGDNASTNTHLLKAQAILNELMVSLNFDVELSANLYQLYEYCHHELVQANVTKRDEGIQSVLEILRGLRAAWQQVARGESSTRADTSDRGALSRSQGGIEIAH